MDSIERYNLYNDKVRAVIDSAVVIKKSKKEGKTILYLVVASTEEITTKIRKEEKLDKTIISILQEKQIIKEEDDIKAVLYCGKLDSFRQAEKVVYKFPIRRMDIKNGKDPEYRKYTLTLQQQKDLGGIINCCRTADESWKSIIKKVGSNYGVLLRVVT